MRNNLLMAALIAGLVIALVAVHDAQGALEAPAVSPAGVGAIGGPAEVLGDAEAIGVDAGLARTTAPTPVLLPEDLFARCATKALRGDYGPLVPWKRDAYVWGLARGVTVCGLAKTTSYGPWDPPEYGVCGQWTASGTRVSEDACAANPEIPFNTIIWTAAYGLRRVQDRGGWVKVGYAMVHGRLKLVTSPDETANFDYFSYRELPTMRRVPWARVKY